jgi:hypothetical protein
MHELDGDRTFAHPGCHALYGPAANVAYNEHAGHIRLQQAGVATERPAFRPLAVPHEIGSRQDEAILVAFDEAREPFSPGNRSDENV